LEKGQRAMLAAKGRKFASSRSKENIASSRSSTFRELEKQIDVSDSHLVRASVILDFAPDLELAVMSGVKTLTEAYKEARDRQLA
jgi:hypothetical protein